MDKLQVPHINASATFTIGTQAISQLQAIAAFMCADIDSKDLDTRLKAGGELTEKERCTVSLLTLLRDLYKDAEQRGLVTYKDLAESISTSL